jgi:hypothetical protein
MFAILTFKDNCTAFLSVVAKHLFFLTSGQHYSYTSVGASFDSQFQFTENAYRILYIDLMDFSRFSFCE